MSLDAIRAQQALAILEQLERLPVGRVRIDIDHTGSGRWFIALNRTAEHAGESLTDALGQLTTVLALEAP